MNSLPYMPLYVADYLADAAHLSTAGHGAYLLMMMTYWQRGEPLPDDDRKLARIARMTDAEWAEVRDDLAEFFTIENGQWVQARVERELCKVDAKKESAKAAGKASAAARSGSKSTPVEQTLNERSTPVEQTLNHTDTDTDTDTEIVNTDAKASCRVLEDDCPHVEAIPIDDEADPNWFEMFWDAYPPRAGDRKRKESESKFALAVKRGTDPRAIIAGAERYRAYCDATRRVKTEYVQQATTWLNNRAWLEPFEIPVDAPSPPPRNGRKESPSEVYARLEAECRQRNQARGAA